VVHSWKAAAFFPTNLSVIHAGALAQSPMVTLLASKLVVGKIQDSRLFLTDTFSVNVNRNSKHFLRNEGK